MSTTLGDFHIDWSDNEQSFTTEEKGRNAKAPSQVSRLFAWTELDRRENPQRIGHSFRHMFYSKLDIPDDEEWEFERPLGKGGFGSAALFRKRGADQSVVDEFALKVADVKNSYKCRATKPGLTKEAATMAQTNDLQCDSIVRLRQFKEHSYERFCLYYLEFCDLGDLSDVILRYRAWKMHLPEPFLWHVFYHLAKACDKFEGGPFRSLDVGAFGEELLEGYLIHCDIKPSNIFLSSNRTSSDGEASVYPIPKLGDFGLAAITDQERRRENRARALKDRGTGNWKPPEYRVNEMRDPNNYFFETESDDEWSTSEPGERDTHRISSDANIWAVGAVMWALVTLRSVNILGAAVNNILQGRGATRPDSDDTHVIAAFGADIQDLYSKQLLQLIRDCTALRPWDRPRAFHLLEILEARMQDVKRQVEKSTLEGDEDRHMVYFKGSELNRLPEGDADLPAPDDKFWSQFADRLVWHAPDDGIPCPPSAPNEVKLLLRCPPAVSRSVQRRWKAAIRARDRKKFPFPPVKSARSRGSAVQRRRKRKAEEMDKDEAANVGENAGENINENVNENVGADVGGNVGENVGGWVRRFRRWRWWQ